MWPASGSHFCNISLLQAAECLIKIIEDELKKEKGKLNVVFVDNYRAFDTVNRNKLMDKLRKMIEDPWTLTLISNILEKNLVQVYDSVARSNWISETNRFPQGDPLSPILFNVLTYDAVQSIKKETQEVTAFMYADDMYGTCIK